MDLTLAVGCSEMKEEISRQLHIGVESGQRCQIITVTQHTGETGLLDLIQLQEIPQLSVDSLVFPLLIYFMLLESLPVLSGAVLQTQMMRSRALTCCCVCEAVKAQWVYMFFFL